MNAEVKDWIEAHRDELIEDIKDLCSIPSVKGAAREGMPFGEGPYRSLNRAIDICRGYGFETRNYENYVGTADFDITLPRSLDILAHTDVVPAGEGWTVTEPFSVVEKDGRLYGRGVSDDKGPLLCALYAMRAVKECGIKLKKGVRLIMGADEECGGSDIERYYSQEPEAEMTFTPDGEFPIINIEKGQFKGCIKRSFTQKGALRLLSMKAGVAVNAVPQKAVILLSGLDGLEIQEYKHRVEQECKVQIEAKGNEIVVYGESAHASTPEHGKNAGIAALYLLSLLPFEDSELTAAIDRLLKLFPYGVTDGSGIGIAMSDAESHGLSCSLDIFSIDENSMELWFDSRTPVSANKENCEGRARELIESAGFSFSTPGMIPPHVVPSDSDFVRTLLSAYEDVSGLKGECLAIGGGTYVHELKNGVAFGAILPGIDTRMHGADEFFDIDNIMTATKIYAEAIIRLCS